MAFILYHLKLGGITIVQYSKPHNWQKEFFVSSKLVNTDHIVNQESFMKSFTIMAKHSNMKPTHAKLDDIRQLNIDHIKVDKLIVMLDKLINLPKLLKPSRVHYLFNKIYLIFSMLFLQTVMTLYILIANYFFQASDNCYKLYSLFINQTLLIKTTRLHQKNVKEK